MNVSAARRWVCLWLAVLWAAPEASAQLSGLYQTAPGSSGVYHYYSDNLSAISVPINLTVSFIEADVAPALSATIVAPIIGVFPEGIYPVAELFPMRVSGISDNSQTYHGDLVGSQYLFDWTVQPGSGDELLLSGRVYWAGGRYELTTIAAVRLIPSLAGDHNQDGTVGADDYILWRKNAGTSNALANDPIGDVIGQAHYDQWRANFGRPTATAATTDGAVPEPAAVGLAIVELLLLTAQRRTR